MLEQAIVSEEAPMSSGERPRIGMLWGDFPWERPAEQFGKLLSMGATARNITRALAAIGHVVPYIRPDSHDPAAQRAALADFLRSIDLVWADLYPETEQLLRMRAELHLTCPVILFAGGVLPKGAEAMLFPWRQLLTHADALVFTCEADRVIWHRLVRQCEMAEWVIPLPIDETLFRPRSQVERTAIRGFYGLPLDAGLILYVGRLNVQKQVHTLLQLFSDVRAVVPHAHLCLVGQEDDIGLQEFGALNTGYKNWLRQRAAALGVGAHITFAAQQYGENLARLYATSDVVVNLSIYHRENFGLAQAEAQACGVPVVCTAWGGFKDIILDGETGFFVDTVLTKHGIRIDWATGVQHVGLLLIDPVLRAQMANAAYEWATERFSGAALARALEPVVATGLGRAAILDQEHPPYTPSRFAQRYDAHKRRSGWFTTQAERQQQYYPPMFHGRDYRIYETLIEPYAAMRADSLQISAIKPEWIPYVPSPIRFENIRRLVQTEDPIWPQRRFLDPLGWSTLQLVDGATPVEQILERLSAQYTQTEILNALRKFMIEGYILFRR